MKISNRRGELIDVSANKNHMVEMADDEDGDVTVRPFCPSSLEGASSMRVIFLFKKNLHNELNFHCVTMFVTPVYVRSVNNRSDYINPSDSDEHT